MVTGLCRAAIDPSCGTSCAQLHSLALCYVLPLTQWDTLRNSRTYLDPDFRVLLQHWLNGIGSDITGLQILFLLVWLPVEETNHSWSSHLAETKKHPWLFDLVFAARPDLWAGRCWRRRIRCGGMSVDSDPAARIYCTNNPQSPPPPTAVFGLNPIVMTLANLSCVHCCGKVTKCSLWSNICILRQEVLCDEVSSFFRWSCLWESAIIRTHVQCVKCARNYCVFLGLRQLSFSKFMSVIHSTATASWLLNFITLFCSESVFCCTAFCERFPRSQPAFSHHLFPLGKFTSPYFALIPVTVYGPALPLTSVTSPLPQWAAMVSP